MREQIALKQGKKENVVLLSNLAKKNGALGAKLLQSDVGGFLIAIVGKESVLTSRKGEIGAADQRGDGQVLRRPETGRVFDERDVGYDFRDPAGEGSLFDRS